MDVLDCIPRICLKGHIELSFPISTNTDGKEAGKEGDKITFTGVYIYEMDNSDPQLVAKSCTGDARAFEELLLRHQDAVFNLAWRMTGNWHDAADLTQETFIRVYRKLHSYRPKYAFKNWALSICANLTKNQFRSNSRRQHKESELAIAQELIGTPTAEGGDEELEAALAQLPETLRVALTLKHMEGLSYEEMAHTLGIGVSAAKMRVARGRDELVRLLDPDKGKMI